MPLVVPWTKSQGEVCVFTAKVKVVLVAFEGVTATDCGVLIPVFGWTLNESCSGDTVMVCANETAENATASNAGEKLDLIRTTFNYGRGFGIISNHVTYLNNVTALTSLHKTLQQILLQFKLQSTNC